MIRNRQRKSTIGTFTEESIKEAVVMVINRGVSTRGAVERMGVDKVQYMNMSKR